MLIESVVKLFDAIDYSGNHLVDCKAQLMSRNVRELDGLLWLKVVEFELLHFPSFSNFTNLHQGSSFIIFAFYKNLVG